MFGGLGQRCFGGGREQGDFWGARRRGDWGGLAAANGGWVGVERSGGERFFWGKGRLERWRAGDGCFLRGKGRMWRASGAGWVAVAVSRGREALRCRGKYGGVCRIEGLWIEL